MTDKNVTLGVLHIEIAEGVFINEAAIVPDDVMREITIARADNRINSGRLIVDDYTVTDVALDEIEMNTLPLNDVMKMKKYGVIHDFRGGYIAQLIDTIIE